MRLYPRLTALIALLLALVLAGCEQSRLTPILPDGTVLAFGDSLTQGVGADPNDSYPAVLARLSGRTFVNTGCPALCLIRLLPPRAPNSAATHPSASSRS